MVKITVVTVCFNSGDTIEKTILSVLEQDYEGIEYIIVDGASSDDTIDIIKRYNVDNKLKFVSEPDDGLYDAMNKATQLATGEYIIFMNSGDVFASPKVLLQISPCLDGVNDLVYGNVIRIKKQGEVLEKYGSKKVPLYLLLQGKMMCHQSIFTRTAIMREYGFNKEYSITADYDFVMRIVHDKRKLKYSDVTVSIVDNVEGISSSINNMDEMRRQDDLSLKTNFPGLYYLMKIPKGFVRWFHRRIENKYKMKL